MGVAYWTSGCRDRVKMVSPRAHVMQHLFALALLPRVFPATTPTTSDTPINTCCPPGHFLAIEDLQQSKQDPEGFWTPDHSNNEHPWHEAWRQHEEMTKASQKTLFTESYMAHKWYELLGLYGRDRYRWAQRLDRHHYISRVFCVPDQNDLPSIDGLSGSSLPSPPYFATAKASISIENRVLAEDQVLRSKGSRLPAQADQQSWLPLYLETVNRVAIHGGMAIPL